MYRVQTVLWQHQTQTHHNITVVHVRRRSTAVPISAFSFWSVEVDEGEEEEELYKHSKLPTQWKTATELCKSTSASSSQATVSSANWEKVKVRVLNTVLSHFHSSELILEENFSSNSLSAFLQLFSPAAPFFFSTRRATKTRSVRQRHGRRKKERGREREGASNANDQQQQSCNEIESSTLKTALAGTSSAGSRSKSRYCSMGKHFPVECTHTHTHTHIIIIIIITATPSSPTTTQRLERTVLLPLQKLMMLIDTSRKQNVEKKTETERKTKSHRLSDDEDEDEWDDPHHHQIKSQRRPKSTIIINNDSSN